MFGCQDISVMMGKKKICTETGFVKQCCLYGRSRVCVKGYNYQTLFGNMDSQYS